MQKNICPFKVPDEKMRLNAIGSLAGTPIKMKKALQAIIPLFAPIPEPGRSDWLWEHDEDGQTYETYKTLPINWIKPPKNVIYIQALEKQITSEFAANLKKFCEAFYFGVQVKIRKSIDVETLGVTKRINEYTGKNQYHAGEILKKLQTNIPSDCYCLIGMLMSDIYPREEWNFVFGLASLKDRTGVFSFARYDENFFEDEIIKPVDQDVILYRSMKVMVHEIGHMFGLRHCIFYSCVMNGSNHLEENKNKRMELCPVCVRKLHENLQFDMLDRYSALANVCKETNSEVFKKDGDLYETIADLIRASYGKYYSSKGSSSNSIPNEETKDSQK